MWGIAGCSALFAAMMYVGALWSLAICFGAMIVGAHVAGNAIGTSLRSQAPTCPARRIETAAVALPDAPQLHLQDRTRLGRVNTVFTLARRHMGQGISIM